MAFFDFLLSCFCFCGVLLVAASHQLFLVGRAHKLPRSFCCFCCCCCCCCFGDIHYLQQLAFRLCMSAMSLSRHKAEYLQSMVELNLVSRLSFKLMLCFCFSSDCSDQMELCHIKQNGLDKRILPRVRIRLCF